jgi:cytochrome c
MTLEIQDPQKLLSSIFNSFAPERCLGIGLAAFALMIVLLLPNSYAVSAAQSGSGVGDPLRGKDLLEKRCGGCHSLDSDKEGPRLRGVFGRKAGSLPSFKYSDALKTANFTWDADSLDKWLTDPDKLIPDNDMEFHLEKAGDRLDVIAYLKQLSNR